MKLRYGEDLIDFEIPPKNLIKVLKIENDAVESLDVLLKDSLMNPIGKPRLNNLLRTNKPRDLVIIVSDITRSIAHYSKILKFLVGEIVDAGVDEKNIEFVIALGTHKKQTQDENRQLYGELVSDFLFSSHDCHNDQVSIGKTSTGLEVRVNKRVKAADFIIATGKINFHYIAGFSGGRKAILPGVSSYETIKRNHSKLRREGVALGETRHNIIAHEMDEAARLFKLDYLLNVVETPEGRTAQMFCGEPVCAFEQGVRFFKSKRTVGIPEKADCAIVSGGGYPRDKKFFLSHKAINLAMNAVKKGGAIILIARCAEGFGNEKFLRYMLDNSADELLSLPEDRIEIGGHRAFVTAKILKDYKVYVLSSLESKVLSQMNFIPIKDLNEGFNQIKKNYGEDFRTYIIPDGQSILPILNGR